ncbi:hypothetical protein DTL21_04615 [Bremerella cremea]|uniref:Uncharacterized protein n=1 Tax=Blastopirellula marina TaxID=124 RepID=A0A2S8FYG0_9BACT|nr:MULTISPECIES: hypothetical protein [Pirellulaceae]PQO37236.1 hypothetical protein C5Y83_04615 [Blastopirellula marina]RCS49623.1 hypothetical protein DTL21_04615 [Bremerella cremea]
MELPPPVQALVDAISALPGVAGCFCSPKPLAGIDVSDLSLPGEFGDLPQVAIMRTEGGRENEVMIQTEVIFDRSAEAWLSIEFLAWWVRDWARSGREIQMRPMALPPKAYDIQLGRTLKFFIEYFLIEDGEAYEDTLEAAGEMAESIASCYELYQDCFANPAEFTGDVESI